MIATACLLDTRERTPHSLIRVVQHKELIAQQATYVLRIQLLHRLPLYTLCTLVCVLPLQLTIGARDHAQDLPRLPASASYASLVRTLDAFDRSM